MKFIGFLIIGAIAGWLAGVIKKGKGFGLWGNLIVGILGAMLGGFLFQLIGLTSTGMIGSLVVSTIGAVLLLSLIGKFSK
ncbi:MAG: GlsB/YeaQ/YmgE family stress response membrane protein [Verrucomicrobiia bacterium]|jgi:uncharacterized membrane protein YeaQ/YmgE (transglycosylase-associated protein family)